MGEQNLEPVFAMAPVFAVAVQQQSGALFDHQRSPAKESSETGLTFSSPTDPQICVIILAEFAARLAVVYGVTRMPHMPYLRAAIVAVAMAVIAAPAARAQESTLDDAQQEAVEGLSKLLQALGLFVKSVPQFSAPEVLPNGDIILRRIHPDQSPAPKPPKSDDDATST